MRKTIINMLVATSLLVSGAAANAVDVNFQNPLLVQYNGRSVSAGFSADLGLANVGFPFIEHFPMEFTSMVNFLAAGLISVGGDHDLGLEFSDFTLTNLTTGLPASTHGGCTVSSCGMTAFYVPAGNYSLNVFGTVTGNYGGSFGGNIALSAVPEASTTAMLLGGLALVGFAASRPRQHKDLAPPTGMFAA